MLMQANRLAAGQPQKQKLRGVAKVVQGRAARAPQHMAADRAADRAANAWQCGQQAAATAQGTAADAAATVSQPAQSTDVQPPADGGAAAAARRTRCRVAPSIAAGGAGRC